MTVMGLSLQEQLKLHCRMWYQSVITRLIRWLQCRGLSRPLTAVVTAVLSLINMRTLHHTKNMTMRMCNSSDQPFYNSHKKSCTFTAELNILHYTCLFISILYVGLLFILVIMHIKLLCDHELCKLKIFGNASISF